MEKLFTAVIGFALAMFASTSHAAITAADLAPIQTDIESSVAAILPVGVALLALVLGLVIGFKLVKRIVSKAT